MTSESNGKFGSWGRYAMVATLAALVAVAGKLVTDRIQLAQSTTRQDAEINELKTRVLLLEQRQSASAEKIGAVDAKTGLNEYRIKELERIVRKP